ncbi:sigma-54 interaction domain protein [Lysobacter antibioticus]|uniref:sigma 54-interacting transcriptional regulator n=1 Tax=Lysobacter antibioticus TaxID=84531 RepID=UPI0007228B63|nr:sigma-54 dependent transcriptional regulator [Lysobacter antibioticus]ALN62692.1 sigma-54 interaction domain protein [Lysobacter antibioticus]
MSMIGESEPMQAIRRLLRRYAGCNAPILIEGETGTGKELAAREVHYASTRSLGPFVPVNCGALPDSLLESELFGHRRGAFTDARTSEPGLVEYANGGTLFLDEIDSLSARAQTILLRFLQNGEYRAIGERPLRVADVRIVAATNISLLAAVEAGHFRRDLLYRLNALYVALPPLRERGDDIALLARHLLREVVRDQDMPPREWSPAALQALARQRWPGNVRELENAILRACLRSDRAEIGVEELSLTDATAHAEAQAPAEPAPLDPIPHEQGFASAKRRAIEVFERTYLIGLMQQAKGNISHAAEISRTERRHLGKLLKRHGIHGDRLRAG